MGDPVVMLTYEQVSHFLLSALVAGIALGFFAVVTRVRG